MNINSGGLVKCDYGTIGSASGFEATAMVSDSGSTWEVSNEFIVGGPGTTNLANLTIRGICRILPSMSISVRAPGIAPGIAPGLRAFLAPLFKDQNVFRVGLHSIERCSTTRTRCNLLHFRSQRMSSGPFSLVTPLRRIEAQVPRLSRNRSRIF